MQKKINQRTLNKKKIMIINVDEFNQIDFWFTNEKISKTKILWNMNRIQNSLQMIRKTKN